ncbi:hypothetical protein J31TS4_26340 [Paenibacillus sp. J31TS4]|uniref:hypothetical protein n=1 Tax=Paenibacillus sp. J31TS4 TaxID=2807195 RepID=UPI001B1633CE|nr:hypothetical protein [Paenibacillus sp. J31TS4]GIP39354.1 hypothetical protein J31TS4_26340 [Paenibacillus sp. J31TS4]
MTEPDKNFRVKEQQGNRDHPEQYPTDNKSLFDMWESEKNVDPIPMEDLNMEQREEKQRRGESKSQSSSAEKYKSGFEK